MSNVMSHQTVSMAELKSVVKEIKTRLINRQSLILIQEVNYNENRGVPVLVAVNPHHVSSVRE
ncbi:hypothetical protein [Photorhabdus bodei]|uniref:Uncharacterized protein n=1 Tax=Photorhabdus bodei TaxID=2029681 RepID=A0A329X3P1_9GAMM|nr:hypothetical protein [Photorhabdus bodei]NDL01337.1 hypothetical protein [Photorhabdus bodei]NDL05626.1 hypothetical protein [Photorhabdus bodei]NDL09839.1 hypothetical protein [Photorhabdus bodei]RAX11524.1 hypothetical protein CKY02_13110 [Photorhabdus bodei]